MSSHTRAQDKPNHLEVRVRFQRQPPPPSPDASIYLMSAAWWRTGSSSSMSKYIGWVISACQIVTLCSQVVSLPEMVHAHRITLHLSPGVLACIRTIITLNPSHSDRWICILSLLDSSDFDEFIRNSTTWANIAGKHSARMPPEYFRNSQVHAARYIY